MIFRHLVESSRLCLAAGLVSLLAACSSTPKSETGAEITKVNPYHLADVNAVISAADPSIPFRRDEILHGAISAEERMARQGNYFTIFWKVDDRQPTTVRLEYRQMNTGLTIKAIEQEVADNRRKNVTKFSLVGDDYKVNGPVKSWKASLVRGKQVIAEYKSFLWE